MRRSRSSAIATAIAVASCGPAHVFHKSPEQACPATGELAIASREDAARYAGCTELGAITIRTGAALELSALARLEVIRGDLAIGPSVGLDEIALPRLREVTGAIRVVANGNLRAVFLPKLERAARIEIDANNAITAVSLPKLATVDSLVITNQPELELVDIAVLATTTELAIADNPKLVMIEGTTAAAKLRVENNTALPADVAARLTVRP